SGFLVAVVRGGAGVGRRRAVASQPDAGRAGARRDGIGEPPCPLRTTLFSSRSLPSRERLPARAPVRRGSAAAPLLRPPVHAPAAVIESVDPTSQYACV